MQQWVQMAVKGAIVPLVMINFVVLTTVFGNFYHLITRRQLQTIQIRAENISVCD